MENSATPSRVPALKRAAACLAAVAIGGAGAGYAVHEHGTAKNLAAQNEQVTAALNATRSQLDDLAAKVNALTARSETGPAQSLPAAPAATNRRAVAPRAHREDPRFKKLQSQVDAQGKEIEETRNDLAGTRGDLANTRTELTGSIARTHDELVVLQKKGERNYYEFDIQKSKQFQHTGPVGISLRKTNVKHEYADLQLMVEDQNLSQKHVNLYQPVMFYRPDSPQPVEVVINNIGKDHIHGYVSAPKYRQSELALMSNTDTNPATSSGQAEAHPKAQPSSREKLAPPQ
jgi:hypothetical protein